MVYDELTKNLTEYSTCKGFDDNRIQEKFKDKNASITYLKPDNMDAAEVVGTVAFEATSHRVKKRKIIHRRRAHD